jgi:hypothetical protein
LVELFGNGVTSHKRVKYSVMTKIYLLPLNKVGKVLSVLYGGIRNSTETCNNTEYGSTEYGSTEYGITQIRRGVCNL